MDFAPRVTLGAVTDDGLGFRVSWWWLDEGSAAPPTGGGNGTSSTIRSAPILGIPGFTSSGPVAQQLKVFNDKVGASNHLQVQVWDAEAFRDFRADYLKGHRPAKNPLLSPVDKAHPTRAHQLGDEVPAEDLASDQFRTHKSRPPHVPADLPGPSAYAPACQGACVVARTVCHQHPARNRGPVPEAARQQQRCCRSEWRRPRAAGRH